MTLILAFARISTATPHHQKISLRVPISSEPNNYSRRRDADRISGSLLALLLL
jgi:hypothetical protein